MSSSPLEGLRVAYVPQSADFRAPGDRRRFSGYAAKRGIRYELPRPGATYDIVVVSSNGDLSYWRRRPTGGPKIVFDLPDSYMEVDEKRDLKARFRGPTKFLLGQNQRLEWSYLQALRGMFERADAVVCSTPEQRTRILHHSNNVHDILDLQGEEVRTIKKDFRVGEPFNLFWEGMGVTVFMFGVIGEVLARIAARRPIALHLMTDLQHKLVNGPLPSIPTRWTVDRYLPKMRTYLYEWNSIMLDKLATACDLGVIPVRMDIPLCRAKAENKLLLLWRMGLPMVTSATPAYVRTMAAAGIQATCTTEMDWEETLGRYLEDEELRQTAADRGRRYANVEHNDSRRLAKWDELFRSILS